MHPDTRFEDQMAAAPIVEVLGVVGVGGLFVASVSSDKPCYAFFTFSAWRIFGSELRKLPLRVACVVSEGEIKRLITTIIENTVVRIKAQVATIFENTSARLISVVESDTSDVQLNARAAKSRKPKAEVPNTFDDHVLGAFTLDPDLLVYSAQVAWNNQTVLLELGDSSTAAKGAKKALVTAHALWEDPITWNQRVCDSAVQELHPLKNECWFEPGDADVTEAQFRERMKLHGIITFAKGKFEFWFDDGAMFGGRGILVSGNLEDGPDFNDIVG